MASWEPNWNPGAGMGPHVVIAMMGDEARPYAKTSAEQLVALGNERGVEV